LKLGKRLKKVVTFLGDMEKLGDALDLIGESYYNLRKYQKAQKWHFQSWQVCKRVKHLEVTGHLQKLVVEVCNVQILPWC
jgi:hypothetical protein